METVNLIEEKKDYFIENYKESVIKNLLTINASLSKLYEEKSELIKTAIKELGTSQPLIKQNDDGTWTRINFVDNQERIQEGYYEFIKVERYSVKVEILKNKPKELVG